MDEGLLNDLLECSVCLERLDTSSRVLPCQHTFCLKCLKVIVESHKELRCPECRILVETRLEELPPNVLLMRILEGMKTAPRKTATPQRSHTQTPTAQARDGKQLPPYGRALYDYNSKEPGDLSFKKGETVLLHKKLDPFWYQGECSGRTGMFPITYVQVVVPLPTPTALCKALYDFRMSAPDEEGCLAFDKGAIITVHRRVDENWAEGRLEQRVGIFPIAFVELNQPARLLMSSTPISRMAPPVPDLAHRRLAQHSHRYQQMSMSTPATVQGNYQNTATMSQSHPNYHQQPQVVPQPAAISHGGLVTTTAVPRNIVEPTKHSLDLIHFTNMPQHIKSHQTTMGLQNVSRLPENHERLRTVKYDAYNTTPIQVDTTYQNVRAEHFPTSVPNNVSSDSSSSMNTPSVGVSSTTTPNTSSNTSTCESNEPSLPSSPDNNTERNQTVVATEDQEENNERESSLNTSMGILSLNESSTATNTSLNVSLPPAESPKPNVSIASVGSQTQTESQEGASNNEPRLEGPSSSKSLRSSGPDSLLTFGLGLQAALSPAHSKDGFLARPHREHHRDKRHSLTPATHLQGDRSSQNRHSAEIVATSLLDQTPERRRRRSRSNERPLPAAYVALYPYKPQKPDELELRKGSIYTVTERCRDGWYKGCGERSQRCGVFPGNYVAPAAPRHSHKQATVTSSSVPAAAPPTALPAPDAPPRALMVQAGCQPMTFPWHSLTPVNQPQPTTPRSEKSKEKSKAEKSSISTGVSLMKKLAAMKKCRSPPPAGYSMDNPVFEDGPGPSLAALALPHHPVHVSSASEGPWQSQHRKSQSLDVTSAKRDRHHSQPVKERFRCIVPYPPNSEYELELQVDDIVIVSKKRGDGWYKGTLQRTGRSGLFPASFVQSCRDRE